MHKAHALGKHKVTTGSVDDPTVYDEDVEPSKATGKTPTGEDTPREYMQSTANKHMHLKATHETQVHEELVAFDVDSYSETLQIQCVVLHAIEC